MIELGLRSLVTESPGVLAEPAVVDKAIRAIADEVDPLSLFASEADPAPEQDVQEEHEALVRDSLLASEAAPAPEPDVPDEHMTGVSEPPLVTLLIHLEGSAATGAASPVSEVPERTQPPRHRWLVPALLAIAALAQAPFTVMWTLRAPTPPVRVASPLQVYAVPTGPAVWVQGQNRTTVPMVATIDEAGTIAVMNSTDIEPAPAIADLPAEASSMDAPIEMTELRQPEPGL